MSAKPKGAGMVDVTRLSAGEARVGRIAAVTRPNALTGAAQPAQTPVKANDMSGVSNMARTLAAQPPVDMDRVAEIKKAIANGDFPILPATIADQMIALKLDWNGK
ncbi:flagellar biosynthesis anti-sigma factor FlgM [Sphingomonas sanguinis]|uniref:Negative regulator of flagellin synthesis n=1 Tax=Sphingomonas sanguinis TaxID=33051 RepID=A0ABU5LUR2_9SPHN|nr:flagellar biosynthesis anti-sigma factor FlgM [Sphingomonas sanguinis]MDZ7283678.1 flagellar biosynthesis anti-sigma factor FlgM [Sphingomonas sanguinis]